MREAEILELLESHDEQGMEELLTHYGPLMRYGHRRVDGCTACRP